MAHPEGTPLVFNRGGILKARKDQHLTEEQAFALLEALQGLEPGATLTQEEANQVVAGGQVDRRGFLAKTFGEFDRGPLGIPIPTADPERAGFLSRSSFGIPLPGTDAEIGVNAPLGLLGLTALTAGLTAPATGSGFLGAGLVGRAGLSASRIGGFTGTVGRTIGVVAPTAIGGGIIATGNQPAPDFTLGDIETADEGTLAQQAAEAGGLPTATLDGDTGDPQGPIERNPVIDSTTGESVPGQFFYTQDGTFVDPGDIKLTPDQSQANNNFINSREGQELLAEQRERAAILANQRTRISQLEADQRDARVRGARTQEERDIVIRGQAFTQGANQRQRAFLASESKAQRDASFINALLPILASPGSRFRFAANVSRLAGGQAQFTPTEQFDRLFRFSGLQPGNPVPLTGEQNFSIIPNIQQFADFGPRERDELEAIIGESSGRSLFGIGRQSKRLAPPR